MIILKKTSEIAKMKEAGRILARTMRIASEEIVPGKTTPRQLDELAGRLIIEQGGIPSFLHYRGYPANTCISVNEAIVHGIPSDRPLQQGDIVGLDFGVIWEGWHADSAWTYPVGEVSEKARRLLSVTKESLYQGIAKSKIGNKIGDIASTIQKYVESAGYGIVRDLVGHGIGRNLHEEPSVPNFGRAGQGPVLKEGMTFCIEPMVNEGTHRSVTLEDGWTAVTEDGKLSAHFEHTVAVTRSGPEILTIE